MEVQNPMLIYETNLLNLIKTSLEDVYCSIILSNFDLIRLDRFVSSFNPRVMEWVLSLF